jgi:hypothetical protein
MLGFGITFAPSRTPVMLTAERTPRDWFQEAARCYLEKHQGCAWCGDSHQVFQFLHGKEVVYYCNGCDFRVSHDPVTNSFRTIPGERAEKTQKKTMFEM